MATVDVRTVRTDSILDGYLYDKLIAPMAVWFEDMIVDLMPEKCTVLEIRCGPRSLACRNDRCGKGDLWCPRVSPLARELHRVAQTVESADGVPE